jgi:hypothetical protein
MRMFYKQQRVASFTALPLLDEALLDGKRIRIPQTPQVQHVQWSFHQMLIAWP